MFEFAAKRPQIIDDMSRQQARLAAKLPGSMKLELQNGLANIRGPQRRIAVEEKSGRELKLGLEATCQKQGPTEFGEAEKML